MPEPLDIKKFTESMMERMRFILESGYEAIPIVLQVKTSQEVEIIGIGGMVGEPEKDAVSKLLRDLINRPETACVVFIADATVTICDKKQDKVTRTESITATITSKDAQPASAFWHYKRVGKKLKFDAEIEWSKEGKVTGRFAPQEQTRKPS